MKHILVTGGAGFLGSHICDLLLTKGFQVTCLDNLITGHIDNIAHNLRNPNFMFIKQDVTNFILTEYPIDGIFHLASPASPTDYIHLPIQTLKAGSIGTHRALGKAKADRAVFLLASTSEIYGNPAIHPQKEDYWGNVNPIGPRSVYDEAKRFAEAVTMAYHNAHGIETRIARIFNTYGPRMRMNDGRIVPEMICQALTGRPITVFGDGSQTRSFCYISDEINGLFKLFESECSHPVNIGNPQEMTVLQFAETVKKLTDSKSEVVFCPIPVDDPQRRQPDITLARSILDWEPHVSLEEGLKETISYFRSKV